MNVKMYVTDEKHEFRQMRPFYNTVPVAAATNVEAAKTPSVENFTGFGVALTGGSMYELSKMDKDERAAFLKDIYSEEGLNLSVGRITIASSDYSADVYSYCDEADENLGAFSVSRDEEYIIPMIKEILAVKPEISLFASPWSPPAWMKTGNNMCGGFMREKYVKTYAEYIVKFIKEYAKHNILVGAVTPQNEPEAMQGGTMPACLWHPDIEAKFILALSEKLKKENLSTKIWMHDHNYGNWERVLYQLEEYPDLPDAVDSVAFHYYEGSADMTKHITEKFPKISWQFTEGGPRLYDNYATDWCKWGTVMSTALANGAESFTGWNLLLDEYGNPNVGVFGCGGLVTKSAESGELVYSGQYKAFRHFSRLIKKGAKIYPVFTDKREPGLFSYPNRSMPVEGVFAENEDGSRVLQLVNGAGSKKQIQFFMDGKWWYTVLSPNSVASFVFEK